MRIACGNQLSPTQNMIGDGMQASTRNTGAGYLPSDNPTSLIGWFRMGVGVTSSGGFASAWADQSGNGNNLLQATGTNQPAYDGSAILTFDGTDNFMKCSAFTLNQPTQVSMLANQITYDDPSWIFDGNTGDSGGVVQTGGTPAIILRAPNNVASNTGMTIGSFLAMTALFNGASSSLKIAGNTATTGNAGANNMGGFTLAIRGDNTSFFANIAVKEIILRNVDDATIRADDHAYLQTL